MRDGVPAFKLDSFPVTVRYTFREDGTYDETVDPEVLETSIESLMSAFSGVAVYAPVAAAPAGPRRGPIRPRARKMVFLQMKKSRLIVGSDGSFCAMGAQPRDTTSQRSTAGSPVSTKRYPS